MSKKFISARPTQSNGTHGTGSYDVGTSLHLRSSSKRQKNLQAYAFHLTKAENLRINLDENARTASIQNYQDNDQPTIVTIPTFESDEIDIENPFPDVPDEEFYSILQYAEILHETAGHYEHTDQPAVNNQFDDLRERLQDFPPQLCGFLLKLGKDLWNAIEDGAIEAAIRNERGRTAAQRLAIKNETFIAQGVKSYPEHAKKNVTFDFALHIAAMDLAKYDTGALRRLFDEEDPTWQFASEDDEALFMDLYPDVRQAVEDALTTPHPVVRTERIFDFVNDVFDAIEDELESLDQSQTSEQQREELRRGQQDDTENQAGPAQNQNSEGLQQQSKQEVAQQHANVTQQTVTTEAPDKDDASDGQSSDGQQDGDGQPGADDGQDDADGQDGSDGASAGEPQPGDEGDSSDAGDVGSDESGDAGQSGDAGDGQSDADCEGDSTTGSETLGNGGGESEESDPMCPSCGDDDVGRLVQQVDGMIAARVNAPFSLTAEWVGSISFVQNDEVCGFRVTTQGDVPVDTIEQSGYKVVDVGGAVEILEPRSRYGDSEPVKGFECNACGHTWVPTIGGDSA